MTEEGKVKEGVKRLLKAHGAYWHMPVSNGMGAPALDFHGCHRGFYYAIETKKGNLGPTPRQALTMQAVEAAGGKTFLINEATGLDELRGWLTCKEIA